MWGTLPARCDMQEFITASRAQIAEVRRTHHARCLSVFGSAVRDDFDPARSDVDLLVGFDSGTSDNRFELHFSLHEALECILHRKVDLIEAGSLKNPYIQRAVERDQRALYAARRTCLPQASNERPETS